MNKKLFLTLSFLILPYLAFSHSGRLDGKGGHKVNKEWSYDGEYLEIENNIPHLEKGMITFKDGDYHYHCKPSVNKIDFNTYRDGIYLPVRQDSKDSFITSVTITENSIVGSINSNLYHRVDCKYIQKIKEENIIVFESIEDAENNNYKSHKLCVE